MPDEASTDEWLWKQFADSLKEVNRRVQIAADAVERFASPVLTFTEDGLPEFVGSGVFARLGDSFYLVSAAHVFDECRGGVYLPHLDNVEDGFEESIYLSGAPGEPRRSDPYDVGFMKLEPHDVDQVGYENFLDLVYTLDGPPPEPVLLAIAIGYPTRDQVMDHEAETLTTKSTVLITGAPDEKAHALVAIDERTHVLLRYRRQDILYNRKTRGSPPPLNGMSGGGIWPVLLHGDDAAVASPPFAALFIERSAKFKSAIIALRAPVIRAFISRVSRGS